KPEKYRLALHIDFVQHLGEVRLRLGDVLIDITRVRKATPIDERVRPGPEAVILAAPPIAKIVTTFFPGAREIADFILLEAGAVERVDGEQIQLRDHIIVRKRRSTGGNLALQRCALLEIEHVKRNVTDAGCDRLVERFAKRIVRLLRQTED